MKLCLLVIVIASSAACCAEAAGETRYLITPVIVNHQDVVGIVINDAGEFAITLGLPRGGTSNELYRSSQSDLILLPNLGGRSHSLADINGNGLLVGSSETATGYQRASLYVDGGVVNLGSFDGEQSSAAAVNDSGLIVGDVRGLNWTRAVVFRGASELIELGSLGGNVSSAIDVNNSGQIVGISLTGKPFGHGGSAPAQEGFIYQNGVMAGIGTLGGDVSNAFAINNVGHVVGESTTAAGEFHAFRYDAMNGMQDLGVLGVRSSAFAISDSGLTVGVIEDADQLSHAVVFQNNGESRLLEELIPRNSNWERLVTAMDVNSRGQIAGVGVIGGQWAGFVLTPVPEPSSVYLAITGLLAWLLRMGRGAIPLRKVSPRDFG